MTDIQAAVVVPRNVEKLPLFHWRPGSRLLMVGSRDGALFSGRIPADEARTFQRSITAPFLEESQTKLGTHGLCAAWSNGLGNSAGIRFLAQHSNGPVVVMTAGFGDAAVLDELLPQVDAWILLIGDEPGPLAQRIAQEGKHTEILLGMSQNVPVVADFPWTAAAAVHLALQRNADCAGPELLRREQQARAVLPADAWIYDSTHNHSECRHCGATLIWRSGGNSRLETLQQDQAICGACQQPVPFVMGLNSL